MSELFDLNQNNIVIYRRNKENTQIIRLKNAIVRQSDVRWCGRSVDKIIIYLLPVLYDVSGRKLQDFFDFQYNGFAKEVEETEAIPLFPILHYIIISKLRYTVELFA